MTSYNIIVRNETQKLHKYIISSEPIDAGDFSNVRTCIIASTSLPPDDEAQFKIGRPNTYYAYAVASYNTQGPGVNVTKWSKKPIQLGQAKPDGTLTPKTSFQFKVRDGTPYLDSSSIPPNGGPKSLAIRTGDDWIPWYFRTILHRKIPLLPVRYFESLPYDTALSSLL